MFEEIVAFIQLNPKRLLFILAFGILGLAAVRAWLCDILGYDLFTRRTMTGDDLFPIFWGEPDLTNKDEREQFLFRDKTLNAWVAYPFLTLASFTSVFFGIISLEWLP